MVLDQNQEETTEPIRTGWFWSVVTDSTDSAAVCVCVSASALVLVLLDLFSQHAPGLQLI